MGGIALPMPKFILSNLKFGDNISYSVFESVQVSSCRYTHSKQKGLVHISKYQRSFSNDNHLANMDWLLQNFEFCLEFMACNINSKEVCFTLPHCDCICSCSESLYGGMMVELKVTPSPPKH